MFIYYSVSVYVLELANRRIDIRLIAKYTPLLLNDRLLE